MRGLIFNYLLEYLEEIHEYAFVDELIENMALLNNGSFADGGLYPDEELIRLIVSASEKLQMEQAAFLEHFGEWMFVPLYAKLETIYDAEAYRQSTIQNAFDFIVMLNAIHYKEVVKLYPNSDFPHFNVVQRTEDELVIEYCSRRKLHYLAQGILTGCIKYFNENLHIDMQPSAANSVAKFTIRRTA
jgi:hypothetical protein